MIERVSYSNAGGKPCQLAALSGFRVRIPAPEPKFVFRQASKKDASAELTAILRQLICRIRVLVGYFATVRSHNKS